MRELPPEASSGRNSTVVAAFGVDRFTDHIRPTNTGMEDKNSTTGSETHPYFRIVVENVILGRGFQTILTPIWSS